LPLLRVRRCAEPARAASGQRPRRLMEPWHCSAMRSTNQCPFGLAESSAAPPRHPTGFVANRPVDLDQYPLPGIWATCKRARNRELNMGKRSESKRLCRRGALALFGYAAVFGLLASPAALMMSDAGAQTPTTPATPSTEAPKSGTERRQERRAGRAERRQERRTGRAERRQARRTGRTERRDGTTEEKK
jgi:hypothetical protein